jgi:hypothetical protein
MPNDQLVSRRMSQGQQAARRQSAATSNVGPVTTADTGLTGVSGADAADCAAVDWEGNAPSAPGDHEETGRAERRARCSSSPRPKLPGSGPEGLFGSGADAPASSGFRAAKYAPIAIATATPSNPAIA